MREMKVIEKKRMLLSREETLVANLMKETGTKKNIL